MIVGIGTDLANITRFEETLEKFGDRFLDRIFTENEKIEISYRKKNSKEVYASAIAKRFAVKEACSKALGTGLRRGTFWRDMEVRHLPTGQPVMFLYGGALEHAKRLTKGGDINIQVTMTDDYPWAQAIVILEKI